MHWKKNLCVLQNCWLRIINSYIWIKNFERKNILSNNFKHRLNVAITCNIKPEGETFPDELPPTQTHFDKDTRYGFDTFAEWDTMETINAVKDSIEEFHDVTLIDADENAFEKLKSHYKFLGVFTIIILSIYFLFFLLAMIGVAFA